MNRTKALAICRVIYFALLVIPRHVMKIPVAIFMVILGGISVGTVLAILNELNEVSEDIRIELMERCEARPITDIKCTLWLLALLVSIGILFVPWLIAMAGAIPTAIILVVLNYFSSVSNKLSLKLFGENLGEKRDPEMLVSWYKITQAFAS